eukprot:7380970-Prymnesium_polylepis.1
MPPMHAVRLPSDLHLYTREVDGVCRQKPLSTRSVPSVAFVRQLTPFRPAQLLHSVTEDPESGR